MDLLTRLNDFMQKQRMSSSQFADAIGIPRPSMSQILNGRNKKISNEFIEKLHQAFPALDMMWLLFGEVTPNLNASLPDNKRKSEPTLFDTEEDTEETVDMDATDDVDDNQTIPELIKNDSDESVRNNVAAITDDVPDDISLSKPQTPTPREPSIDIKPASSTATDITDDNIDNNDVLLPQGMPKQSTDTHSNETSTSVIKIASKRSIDTIIVFYDDNTYQRFKAE